MKNPFNRNVEWLENCLDYEKGKLSHITHWIDTGFLSISLTEYQTLTPYQILAFKVAVNEIYKWKSKQKPLVTI